MPALQAQKKGVGMTDQPQAQMDPEVVQEAPMPSAEQQTSETNQVEEAAPQEVTSQHTGSEGLPEDASERTRREFEKLRADLREERARRESYERTIQTFVPRTPVVEPPKPLPIYDPSTGLLNENALTEMQRQSQQAQQEVQAARQQLQEYQDAQERKEAYNVHPELNPESKSFSKEISIETRKVILDNMTHPEDYDNRQLSFKEAADMVKERFKPMIDKAQQQGAKQAIEKITPKEQASLEVTGTQSGKATLNEDAIARLRIQTRKGGDSSIEAIMQRMKGVS